MKWFWRFFFITRSGKTIVKFASFQSKAKKNIEGWLKILVAYLVYSHFFLQLPIKWLPLWLQTKILKQTLVGSGDLITMKSPAITFPVLKFNTLHRSVFFLKIIS
jgi:hypothetical protein